MSEEEKLALSALFHVVRVELDTSAITLSAGAAIRREMGRCGGKAYRMSEEQASAVPAFITAIREALAQDAIEEYAAGKIRHELDRYFAAEYARRDEHYVKCFLNHL